LPTSSEPIEARIALHEVSIWLRELQRVAEAGAEAVRKLDESLIANEGAARAAPEAELMSPQAAAELLGIGKTTIFEMLKRNELTAVRAGRIVRVRRQDCLDWVERKLAEGAKRRSA
jgi:excisionase family DNA binding protein